MDKMAIIWTIPCKSESNTFSNCVICFMKNGHLHGNCSLLYIRLLHSFGGVIKWHNINQCNSMYVENMTKSTK